MSLFRILIGSIFLFFLMNCPPSGEAVQVDEVQPYVSEFIRIGKLFNIKGIETRAKAIEIRFGKTTSNQLGLCYFYRGKIILNEKKWRGFPPENREEIIFHELGHCVLDYRDHTETGIMRTAGVYNPYFYRKIHSYLINDLFFCETGNCIEIEWDGKKYETLNKEKQVTKADILNNTHAVVRFTATWCPPCKALAPVFDEVAAAHPDVKTYVIDVDENQDLANDLNVRGIPTCMAIRNNAVSETLVGNQPKPELEKLFK